MSFTMTMKIKTMVWSNCCICDNNNNNNNNHLLFNLEQNTHLFKYKLFTLKID